MAGLKHQDARQRTSQLGGRFFLICLLSGAAWPVISTPLLFPHLTVADNLGFGLVLLSLVQPAQTLLKTRWTRLGWPVWACVIRKPYQAASRPTCAFAHLLAQPRALLLDEPFSSLDGGRREEMVKLVREEAVKRKLPVLLVSHDPRDEALPDKPPYRLGA